VLECSGEDCFDDVLHRSARAFSARLDISEETIYAALNASNRLGETPIGNHIALPHTRVAGVRTHELVIVRARDGLHIEGSDEEIYAIFVLLGPTDDPGQHLRFLAELANRAEGVDFAGSWRELADPEEIRRLFMRSGEVMEVAVTSDRIVGTMIRDLCMPDGCLIAFIMRGEKMIVPHGNTGLEAGDLVTLVGETDAVLETAARFTA
jgi:mannitol/fructose-specific phosphotransferase system IIA component (Ntr-type)